MPVVPKLSSVASHLILRGGSQYDALQSALLGGSQGHFWDAADLQTTLFASVGLRIAYGSNQK